MAHRIAAALRTGGRPFVLVTGDPAADAETLSEALRDVTGPAHTVIVISCGPDLRRDDIDHRARGCASPLFVFGEFDRLSDRQIEEICEAILRRSEGPGTAVLLTSTDFLARLDRLALHFLKQYIAAQLRTRELGDEEAIAFLHHQLLAQRDRRVEAGAFRRGIAIGLAGGGVAIAASLGAFMLRPTAEQVCEAPASPVKSNAVAGSLAMLQPAEHSSTGAAPVEFGPNSVARSSAATAPSPPTKVEEQAATVVSAPGPAKIEDPASTQLSGASAFAAATRVEDPNAAAGSLSASAEIEDRPLSKLPPVTAASPGPIAESDPAPTVTSAPANLKSDNPAQVAASSAVPPPAGPRLSAPEVAALLARGAAFLKTGDITSARLCYERAADAESGLGALRLGATFDPAYPARAGLGAITDPAQALLWYRRARDLGVSEAEPRIKALEAQLPKDPHRPR